jgi:hypothetical protein
VVPLIVMAIAAAYTAILLGECLMVPVDVLNASPPVSPRSSQTNSSSGYQAGDVLMAKPSSVNNAEYDTTVTQSTYGDIGHLAFGAWGRYIVDGFVYLNLLGASTLFLILSGRYHHRSLTLTPHSHSHSRNQRSID